MGDDRGNGPRPPLPHLNPNRDDHHDWGNGVMIGEMGGWMGKWAAPPISPSVPDPDHDHDWGNGGMDGEMGRESLAFRVFASDRYTGCIRHHSHSVSHSLVWGKQAIVLGSTPVELAAAAAGSAAAYDYLELRFIRRPAVFFHVKVS